MRTGHVDCAVKPRQGALRAAVRCLAHAGRPSWPSAPIACARLACRSHRQPRGGLLGAAPVKRRRRCPPASRWRGGSLAARYARRLRRVHLEPRCGATLLHRAAGQAPRGCKPETTMKSSAVRAPPCGLGGVLRAVARPTADARRAHAAHRHRADRNDAAAVQPGPHLPERRHRAHRPGVWLGARTAGESAPPQRWPTSCRLSTFLPSTAPCCGHPQRTPQPEPRAACAAGRRAVGLPVGLHGDAAAGRHARGPLRRCAGAAALPRVVTAQPPCARSIGGPAAQVRSGPAAPARLSGAARARRR